jgi:hypothetical protein
MFMKTESGATSIGSPGSAARIEEEAAHVIRSDYYQGLLLTDEGKELLTRFAKTVGSDFTKMTNLDASNWIETEQKALFSFLAGVRYMYHKIETDRQRALVSQVLGT